MYINLNGTIAPVVSLSSSGDLNTIGIKGQTDINAVLAAIGDEIRLYSDQACTILTAIYKSINVTRITLEPDKAIVTLSIRATKVADLTEEQLRADIAAQNETIAAQAAQIASLEEELAAAKILLGINEEQETEAEDEPTEPEGEGE